MTDRRDFLGASDSPKLMNGDAEAVYDLWLQKTGQAEPQDLSDNWHVQRGINSEQLNALWYEKKSGEMLFERGKVRVHPKYPWLRCTLDGWDNNLGCPFEAKDVNSRSVLVEVLDRYAAQFQHQMLVTGAKQVAASIIIGGDEPRVEYIERDDDYIAELLARAIQFWDCVQRRVPPVELPAVPPPAEALRVYDMTGNNEWAAHAATWRETRAAAEVNADVAKSIKTLVPADAKKCHGHGVSITRNKAGTLSLREAKP